MSVKAMAWAWDQDVADPALKLILLRLADHADERGYSWPSMTTLAACCQISVRTTQRKVQLLVDMGLLEVRTRRATHGGLTSNGYLLRVPTPGVTRVTTPGDSGVTTLVSPVSPLESPVEPPGSGSNEPSPGARRERARDELWDALEEIFGPCTNSNTRGRRNRALKLLRESKATPDEIRERAQRYRQVFPNAAFTSAALANQWDNLAPPRVRRPAVCPDCEVGGGFHAIDCPQTRKESA